MNGVITMNYYKLLDTEITKVVKCEQLGQEETFNANNLKWESTPGIMNDYFMHNSPASTKTADDYREITEEDAYALTNLWQEVDSAK